MTPHDHTEFTLTEGPRPLVRYASGRFVYVETLTDGRLLGRYWSSSGRVNNAGRDLWADHEAFRLRVDGRDVTGGWQWVSAVEEEDREGRSRHCVVRLQNPDRQIAVAVHTTLDRTSAIGRWLEITNESDTPVALDAVDPWCGRLWWPQEVTAGWFSDYGWAMEGQLEWQRVPEGELRIQGDRGLRKHNAPFFILRNDERGEYFAAHLAWTGNWEMLLRRGPRGIAFDAGPATAMWPLRAIALGETIATPAVHAVLVAGALDDAVQAMHDHLRRAVLPPLDGERLRRVQLLVPADQGYHTPLDAAGAIRCIDLAASIGVELFILDFGWWDATCDWFPSAARYPDGLEPIIAHTRERGMLFGLYLETEGGRGNVRESRAYREHPEWFWPKDILDLTNPVAAAWMESEICRIVDRYRIDLFRLDFNPDFTMDGPAAEQHGITENRYWRYCEALYGVYERVRRRYPSLILQQAAAGGGRNDLGMAMRFHENYLTDGLWFPRALEAFSGTTLGLPPEALAIACGASGGAHANAADHLETTLRISYALSFPHLFGGWIAPGPEAMTAERTALFDRYDTIYKRFVRPLLPTCRVYHHEPVNSRSGVGERQWFAMEFSAPDRSKAWALVARLRPGGDTDTYVLRCRGIDPARAYRVTFDSARAAAVLDGLRLREGVPIRLESAGMSELLIIEEAGAPHARAPA